MICAFIVMKCEGFSMITDLVDYLNNNLLIAHYCGFDISLPLPSYWTFDRFLKNFNQDILSGIMHSQVLFLSEKGIIDTSFIGLDSTPVSANTSHNNPKSFLPLKFKPDNQPKADRDCKLGVHTASNQTNEKKYQFYWGYKNHVLVDCISGLPIYELTTTAEVADSTVALDILAKTHDFLPVSECTFLADKGYDVKNIYNQVRELYNGECIIPLNRRNSKDTKLLPVGVPACEAGLAMNRDGRCYDQNRVKQKYCCPFKLSGTCPINHVKFHNGKKNRGCTKWITIQMIYVFSLTATVNILNPATPCVQNAKDTIRDLKIPVKNECGYGISPPLRTLIRLHISAFWRLLLHLSLCPAASLTGN